MKMLSFLENMNSTYGGPAFSLPNLLHTLSSKYKIENSIISLKKKGGGVDNKLVNELNVSTILYDQFGPDKIKFTTESNVISELAKNYDVIHTNNLWNYFSYLPHKLSEVSKKPNIISVRGALYPWSLNQSQTLKKISWSLFQRRALEKAGFIHVTCAEEYQAVRDLGIKNRIVISQHGVDVPALLTSDNIPSEFYKKYGLSKEKRYFLFMSRLHTKKGLDFLLKVWGRLLEKHPEWTLLIAGPDYGGYVSKINKMPGKSVKYMGMLEGDDKENCFAISEFFVLPSFSENFGVVVGEAMARAVPVLTTTNTPWQIINERDAGVCFELSEENVNNELIKFLSADSAILRIMGQNARQLICDNYSWDQVSYPFYEAIKSL